ncbi:MAG: AlkZ family DNA glycosylase [Chlorobia bacterium]|nr:AlkZ family DNA glycosylase [Fimbriimonadaceae bacterium]
MDIALQRLRNQRLLGEAFASPVDVVKWLGAVQSQDYHGAKWGVAQRTKGALDSDLDRLYNEGAILRTHVLRPTWHFVTPEDIVWMLELTAPRVHAASAYYYRKTELDPPLLSRCGDLIGKALAGDQYLTRNELAARLRQEGIEAEGLRMGYIVGYLELEALICSGPMRGKQFTYALLEERAPHARRLDRDEALAELTRRYFTSHGPAMVQDFGNWSGLTIADGKAGIDANREHLTEANLDGKSYWMTEMKSVQEPAKPVVHLLPNYDEHVIAYKDYTPAFDPEVYARLEPNDYRMLAHLIARNGKIVGGWRRTIARKQVRIEASLLEDVGEVDISEATKAYSRFLGLPVEVDMR